MLFQILNEFAIYFDKVSYMVFVRVGTIYDYTRNLKIGCLFTMVKVLQN